MKPHDDCFSLINLFHDIISSSSIHVNVNAKSLLTETSESQFTFAGISKRVSGKASVTQRKDRVAAGLRELQQGGWKEARSPCLSLLLPEIHAILSSCRMSFCIQQGAWPWRGPCLILTDVQLRDSSPH